MNTIDMRPVRPSRADAGFTLLAVLIAVAIMAGLVATYGRHVIVAGRGGMASPSLLATRDACHSGLAYARQSLVCGEGSVASSIPAGGTLAMISVDQTAGGDDLVSVESVTADGLGARRTAQLALQPVPESVPEGPAALPTLSPETIASVLAGGAPPVLHITQQTRFQGTEMTNLLVVHPGVELQLADVVLHGAVISSATLSQGVGSSYDAEGAPRLLVDGNLRIDPSDAMPGLAILLPDGNVSCGVADLRIQIHGDVVAHDVTLLRPGALSGNVAGVNVALADPSELDRLGIERKPPQWSPALDLGEASEPVFLAMVPPSTSLGALSGIIGYWTQN